MLRAIETRYKGYRFRSRLEARWAVFFDALDVRWEYEPEGFSLPSGWYLPDLHLPEFDLWAEIKPAALAPRERLLAHELCRATCASIVLLVGVPDWTWYELLQPPFEYVELDGTRGRCDDVTIGWLDLASTARDNIAHVYNGGGDAPGSGIDRWSLHDRAVTAARGARFEHHESPAA